MNARMMDADGAAGWRFCREMAGYERMIDAALRKLPTGGK